MMYRLQGASDWRGLVYSQEKVIVSSLARGSSPRRDFEQSFTEVPVSPPWPHCRLMMPPEIPPSQFQNFSYPLLFDREEQVELLADISPLSFTLVSKRCKEIIEKVDPWPHQFWPADIQLAGGGSPNRRPFYWMSVRRCVDIDELGLANKMPRGKKWRHVHGETYYMPAVLSSPELQECLGRLPLWQAHQVRTLDSGRQMHTTEGTVIYMNEEMLHAFQDAGLMGVNLFAGGYPKETDTVFSI